jgi:hypothetical protein
MAAQLVLVQKTGASAAGSLKHNRVDAPYLI